MIIVLFLVLFGFIFKMLKQKISHLKYMNVKSVISLMLIIYKRHYILKSV